MIGMILRNMRKINEWPECLVATTGSLIGNKILDIMASFGDFYKSKIS